MGGAGVDGARDDVKAAMASLLPDETFFSQNQNQSTIVRRNRYHRMNKWLLNQFRKLGAAFFSRRPRGAEHSYFFTSLIHK